MVLARYAPQLQIGNIASALGDIASKEKQSSGAVKGKLYRGEGEYFGDMLPFADPMWMQVSERSERIHRARRESRRRRKASEARESIERQRENWIGSSERERIGATATLGRASDRDRIGINHSEIRCALLPPAGERRRFQSASEPIPARAQLSERSDRSFLGELDEPNRIESAATPSQFKLRCARSTSFGSSPI